VSNFLIALLVVGGFVWGNWMWLRPSPREQRLMALREAARRQGFHVRLLPPPDWYRGEKPRGGLLACYSLLTGDEERGLPYFRAERLADGEWLLRQGRAEAWQALLLPPAASQLIALEARANAVSLWWTEQATPADLTALQALLTDLMQRLR